MHHEHTPPQARSHQIVGIQTGSSSCPLVTFRLHAPPITDQLLVTLTLCEWREIAHKIAEAAVVLHS